MDPYPAYAYPYLYRFHVFYASTMPTPSYLRLLGMTQAGRLYLNENKKRLKLPLVSKAAAFQILPFKWIFMLRICMHLELDNTPNRLRL